MGQPTLQTPQQGWRVLLLLLPHWTRRGRKKPAQDLQLGAWAGRTHPRQPQQPPGTMARKRGWVVPEPQGLHFEEGSAPGHCRRRQRHRPRHCLQHYHRPPHRCLPPRLCRPQHLHLHPRTAPATPPWRTRTGSWQAAGPGAGQWTGTHPDPVQDCPQASPRVSQGADCCTTGAAAAWPESSSRRRGREGVQAGQWPRVEGVGCQCWHPQCQQRLGTARTPPRPYRHYPPPGSAPP